MISIDQIILMTKVQQVQWSNFKLIVYKRLIVFELPELCNVSVNHNNI